MSRPEDLSTPPLVPRRELALGALGSAAGSWCLLATPCPRVTLEPVALVALWAPCPRLRLPLTPLPTHLALPWGLPACSGGGRRKPSPCGRSWVGTSQGDFIVVFGTNSQNLRHTHFLKYK